MLIFSDVVYMDIATNQITLISDWYSNTNTSPKPKHINTRRLNILILNHVHSIIMFLQKIHVRLTP